MGQLIGQADQPIETELRHADGSAIPVEFIVRPVEFEGRPHHAIAVRDLRPHRRAESRIRFLAHHDSLTGLANRSSFQDALDHEIDEARATGQDLAVLCLDLDRFKDVNDLFGHAAGDALLRRVAKAVTNVLRKSQVVGRLGGDEFAILLPAVSGPSVAGRVAEDILAALHAQSAGEGAARISASIGVAMYPTDGADRQTLLTHANTALNRAKLEGGGAYRFFEAKLAAEVHDRRAIERDLRQAVADNELSVVYQPLTNIRENSVIGFEALLRWRHPTRGPVSPAQFIPIAEESGAILEVGEWVLERACKEAATWTTGLIAAVNVSAVQLHGPEFRPDRS